MLKVPAIFVWHEKKKQKQKKLKIAWLTLPCCIDTSWGTLSVLALAKQWAAVSTQFGLRIDPKQSGVCKGRKMFVCESPLFNVERWVEWQAMQSSHLCHGHTDMPGFGVEGFILLWILHVFLSYPTHRHTLVTCVIIPHRFMLRYNAGNDSE